MANQLQVTVYKIGQGSALSTPLTLSFPTNEISAIETTISTLAAVNSQINYFPNPNNPTYTEQFFVSEEVADLLNDANTGGTSMIQAAIYEQNGYPIPTAITGLFPAKGIQIFPVSGDPIINSQINFNGQTFGVSDTENDLVTAANAGGGGSSYLVYTALLSQSGTDAPVATVLENTLGGSLTWSRNDSGDIKYIVTSSGLFTSGKTAVILCHDAWNGATGFLGWSWISANEIYIIFNNEFGNYTDMEGEFNVVKIFVYP